MDFGDAIKSAWREKGERGGKILQVSGWEWWWGGGQK